MFQRAILDIIFFYLCGFNWFSYFDYFSLEFFGFRTDVVKDESDYSDVYVPNAEFEYEVDDSSASEDIESHDTSSGIDVIRL